MFGRQTKTSTALDFVNLKSDHIAKKQQNNPRSARLARKAAFRVGRCQEGRRDRERISTDSGGGLPAPPFSSGGERDRFLLRDGGRPFFGSGCMSGPQARADRGATGHQLKSSSQLARRHPPASRTGAMATLTKNVRCCSRRPFRRYTYSAKSVPVFIHVLHHAMQRCISKMFIKFVSR